MKSTQKPNVTSKLYLIRSYHHENKITPPPSTVPTPRTITSSSRANTGISTNPGMEGLGGQVTEYETKNYERAQEFEIWQVARAATAAPNYFEPMRIEMARTSGSILFTDGGFSHTNNPSEEGRSEIEELHGHNKIGIFVSVGTARKMKKEKNSFFKFPGEFRRTAYTATDPEIVHAFMTKQQQGFTYYRLNDLDGLDIEFDRWEPKQYWSNHDVGSHTIRTIENTFFKWAGRSDSFSQLKGCAEMLVDCRRSRMLTDNWERYATGAQYRCCYKSCGREDICNGNKFRAHLKECHHIQDELLQRIMVRCRSQWQYQDGNISHAH